MENSFGKITCRRSQIKEKTVVRFSPWGDVRRTEGFKKSFIVNRVKGKLKL